MVVHTLHLTEGTLLRLYFPAYGISASTCLDSHFSILLPVFLLALLFFYTLPVDKLRTHVYNSLMFALLLRLPFV